MAAFAEESWLREAVSLMRELRIDRMTWAGREIVLGPLPVPETPAAVPTPVVEVEADEALVYASGTRPQARKGSR